MNDAARADAVFARQLATETGALLSLRRAAWPEYQPGLAEAADREAQDFLAAGLATSYPDDAILSEEAPDDERRLAANRVWIIDPLDGSREYAEGRHDWAVHVALWVAGGLTAAAVALPGRGTTLSTDVPPPAPVRNDRRLRLAVSRSRASSLVQDLADLLDAELVPMGSAGYKTSAVVLGEVDAYVHSGGQFQWDSAAPVGVAQAAGLHASRLDGSPLRYNDADPYLPDLVVCQPAIADAILAACAAHETAELAR